MSSSSNKEQWGSRIGVIFAVMGSAIGLGNFLRFPSIAARNDGGAFLIPYFISLLILGIPIALSEWSVGRFAGQKGYSSAPGIFRAVWRSRIASYLGVFGLIIPIGVYMYYIIIEAMCLYYSLMYLIGAMNLGTDPNSYVGIFVNFTGMAEDGAVFFGSSPALYFLLVAFVINFVIIYRGIGRGIEMISRLAIPVLFISAFVVLARVLTLGTPDPSLPDRNLLNALGFMWNPPDDWASLLKTLSRANIWLEAGGQVFFSLSVGFGIIITYSSYLKQNDDVILSGSSSVAGNMFAEVALGGLITIPAAYLFFGPEVAGKGTMDMGFITLPLVFQQMPLGQIVGFLWFFLLFIAAVTSSISMLQPAIAFFEEGLGTGRRVSVTLLGIITLIGAFIIAYFSKDMKALTTVDFWVGSFFIYTFAMVEVILFGWFVGADRIFEEAKKGSLMGVSRWMIFVFKYISPLYLTFVFVMWIYQEAPGQIQLLATDLVTQMSIGFILVLVVFLVILVSNAIGRWEKMENENGVLKSHKGMKEGGLS